MTSARIGWRHQPPWPDEDVLQEITSRLRSCHGLINPAVCERLRRELARVESGGAFVVQAGDCAERFAETGRADVFAKARMLDEVADVAEEALDTPVVRIGRLGGQFAKPRSKATERLPDGSEVLTYRGDAVNDTEPTVSARTADPHRLVLAYDHSARVLDTLGLNASSSAAARSSTLSLIYTAHEALLLDYEEALVRVDPASARPYATSGHFLWVGERTREIDDAHIRFLTRIANPIGVKLGPTASPDGVRELIHTLDPDRTPGRLTLIVRMGHEDIKSALPRIIDGLGDDARHVIWMTDPMHGNTVSNAAGRKTRIVDDILTELEVFSSILGRKGFHPGGLHLECTPTQVTECVDSEAELDKDLSENYRSGCDPRLSPRQTERVVRRAAEMLDETVHGRERTR